MIQEVEADLKANLHANCPGFVKKHGYWNKLNGFCWTGVRLHITKLTSWYEVWVSSGILYSENPGITEQRFSWSYERQAGFADFMADIKRQTLINEPVTIDDIISEFHRQKILFCPHYLVQTRVVARFFRDGKAAALAELEGYRADWDRWNPAICHMLGGNWGTWAASVVDQLDSAKIRQARDAYLAERQLKLQDFGIVGIGPW